MPLPVPDISRNLFDLSGYCSIVTGAGQGIGLVLAEALAYAGSDLVLTERNAEHLKVAAGKIEAIGRNVTTVACDVAADDTPDRLVKAALALSGRIDVLINNAGFMTFADMLTVEDAVWDNIYAVNVRAPMRITRAVLPEMVKQSLFFIQKMPAVTSGGTLDVLGVHRLFSVRRHEDLHGFVVIADGAGAERSLDYAAMAPGCPPSGTTRIVPSLTERSEGGRSKCSASPLASDDGSRTNSLLGCRAFASLVRFASKRKRSAESANS